MSLHFLTSTIRTPFRQPSVFSQAADRRASRTGRPELETTRTSDRTGTDRKPVSGCFRCLSVCVCARARERGVLPLDSCLLVHTSARDGRGHEARRGSPTRRDEMRRDNANECHPIARAAVG